MGIFYWEVTTMNFLEERIVKDGVVKSGNVLKVDSFLNHQMDISLMQEIGREFKRRFGHKTIDRILTIEASGIGIAIGGGLYVLGTATAILTLIGMELLPLLTRNLKVKHTRLIILIDMKKDLSFLTGKMDEAGYRIMNFSVEQPKKHPDKFRVEFMIDEHNGHSENKLVKFLQSFPDLELIIEKIE